MLLQERLHYDNEITRLEKAIAIRGKNLLELQKMHNDAESARDMAKVIIIN